MTCVRLYAALIYTGDLSMLLEVGVAWEEACIISMSMLAQVGRCMKVHRWCCLRLQAAVLYPTTNALPCVRMQEALWASVYRVELFL